MSQASLLTTPPPASPPPASYAKEPAPVAAPPSPAASEPKIPDKFIKDGKPDLAAFVASYGELETRFLTKTETLKAEIAAEALKNRPADAAGYVLPVVENVDPKELAEHPMVEWWRKEAFDAGLPQARFEEGVKQYIEKMAPREIPEAELRAGLGDSFRARIAAVDAWAKKEAQSPEELQALATIATSINGLKMLERLSGIARPQVSDDPVQAEPAITLEQLRSMQADPRYYDATRRDPAFVQKVEAGYAKLYPATPKR